MADSNDSFDQLVMETWRRCLQHVLEQVSGAPAEVGAADDLKYQQEAKKHWEDGAWICFSAGKGLEGEHAFSVSVAGAVSLAQAFMGEPENLGAEFSDDYKDAIGELFRQVAGAVALDLKPKLGTEIALNFLGQHTPAWQPARCLLFQIRRANRDPVIVSLLLDGALVRSIETFCAPASVVAPAANAPQQAKTDNMGLFLDIELEAILRFGERDLLLREVLELNTGSIVELDHRVSDPVELLVGGKVIAKGEVVVMDGNYALRVTEVLSPSERMASLRN